MSGPQFKERKKEKMDTAFEEGATFVPMEVARLHMNP